MTTTFRFNPVVPDVRLAPYVSKMWVFESSGRLPALDRKLIVPNANFKLTLTCRNGLVARIGDTTFVQEENELSLSGLIDTPVNLDPQEDVPTGTIIIEFNALGVYRLFRLRYSEVKNQIVLLSDLFGSSVKGLQEQLANSDTPEMKVQVLQGFLIGRLEKESADVIYDYCIRRIDDSRGAVTVAQLEKETGYSARWLHQKFLERLGTGPKNLAEIVRFKQFYQAYSSGVIGERLKEHIYHYYYDQSHFLRAFKRFTGSTPTDLQNGMNDLANLHYTS